MTIAIDKSRSVGVIGAGTMGAGIAQVAAAAGHNVQLFDASPGAANKAREKIAAGLAGLVERGRLEQEQADSITARISVANDLKAFADAALVIEAIIEDLTIKQDLFAKLEGIVGRDAILASNTSSISLTSIAAKTSYPDRVAGLHFFNPAPVMKLVEVVSGVATSASVAEVLLETARSWGKVAVSAKSTPGFIVNRVARSYYAEALRLLEEQVADPATLDALLTEGAGFRMGPFELMDLIGNDVNYAVSCSVFESFYHEPRFRPSLVQRELVDAGFLGRKSGRGFYNYEPEANRPAPAALNIFHEAARLRGIQQAKDVIADGVLIARTEGRTAAERSAEANLPCVLLDLTASTGAKRVGVACSHNVEDAFLDRLAATLADQDMLVTRLPDWPGLVAMRTVAMLANEAFEASLQGVASLDGIDDAMRFGVNYPKGPVAWAKEIGLETVVKVLDSIHRLTGDPRYRTSLGLRLAAGSQSA